MILVTASSEWESDLGVTIFKSYDDKGALRMYVIYLLCAGWISSAASNPSITELKFSTCCT